MQVLFDDMTGSQPQLPPNIFLYAGVFVFLLVVGFGVSLWRIWRIWRRDREIEERLRKRVEQEKP